MGVAAIPAVMSIASGVMGANAAKDAAEHQQDAINQNRALLNSVTLPDIEKQKLALQQYTSAGEYNPEILAQLQQLGPSALENINIDPRLKQSQMSALEQMSQRAMGGMSDADAAAFELAKRNSAGEAQAKSQQILQNMQQRGQSGSGAELAAQLQNAQSSADRLAQSGLQEAIAQQNAKQNALQQLASMSGNIRNQDYNEQSNLMNKRDAIAAANMNDANRLAQSNVATRNAAAASNLANKQRLIDSNTNLSHDQQKYNKQLLQQDYDNRLARATGNARLNTEKANISANTAKNQGAMMGTVGQGIAGMATNYFNQAQPVQTQQVQSQGGVQAQNPFNANDFAPQMQSGGYDIADITKRRV
jgi:hypothetical protein